MTFKKNLLKKFLQKRSDAGWFNDFKRSPAGIFYCDLVFDYIKQYLSPEESLILDIGLDPGIFAEKIAVLNRKLIITDISEEQMQITRERFEKKEIASSVEQYTILDSFSELTQFEDESFDMIISTFGTLSFACENKYRLFGELVRIVKKGAPILLTVKNKLSYLRQLVNDNALEKILEPTKSGIWDFIETNLKQYEEYPLEPVYYGFTSEELTKLAKSHFCEILELRAINTLGINNNEHLNSLMENEEAWNNLLDIEKRISSKLCTADSGDEILLVVRKAII